MNLKEILKENGYEIISEIEMKYLRLKFTEEKLKEMMKEKDLYDYDISGAFNVKISEVGFNGYGDLYIVLECMDDEHFEIGDTFDVIEYEEGQNPINSILDKDDLRTIEVLLVNEIARMEKDLEEVSNIKLKQRLKEKIESYEATTEKIIEMRYLR